MENFFTVMISCPQRDTVRAKTIYNLMRTDWPDIPFISMADGGHDRPQSRQEFNSKEALKVGIESGKRFILFLEDDLEFNNHLFHNLTHWHPFPHVTMASLYNPNIREINRSRDFHYFEADPEAVYGSQAYLFSRHCAQFIVANWDSVPGMQDIKCSRIAARLGKPIFYFSPSLVQHVGNVSTFGGGFHQTADFDQHFKL